MHLRQLELGLGADSVGEGSVANDVSERLPTHHPSSVTGRSVGFVPGEMRVPLRLVLHVHLPLGVVANVADLREASDVELLCAELRHVGGGGGVQSLETQT